MKNHRINRFCQGILGLMVLTASFAFVSAPVGAEMLRPECVFWEGPDVRPAAKDTFGVISQCPCFVTGIVKNIGSAPAYYVHVIATIWDSQTEELVHASWAEVAGGTIQPGEEEFIRFPIGLSDIENPDYERRVSLRWKNEQFKGAEAECMIESTFTSYREDSPTFLCGFIKNVDKEAGFAPALRGRLVDGEGKTANIINAGIPKIPLEPGETLPFALAIPAVSPTDSIKLLMEKAVS
jgi:hypothetical protein